jgi:hypothetical protein
MSEYKVHSVVIEQLPVSATTPSGREVTALVPGLVVELVPDGNHDHSSVTRRYIPTDDSEMQRLLSKYKVGAPVLVTTASNGNAPEPDSKREPGAAHPVHESEETADVGIVPRAALTFDKEA